MEKINVAELLKDCPKGMELDCTMFSKVTLVNVGNKENIPYPIKVEREDGYSELLTKYGQYVDADFAKCVIFPKGKTTWEGFVPPRQFKDGDVLFVDCADKESDGDVYKYIFILKEIDSLDNYFSYCHLSIDGFFPSSQYLFDNRYIPRLATEEEKQKLFQVIKANGYKWNPDNKTLERLIEPKFKVGDRIKLNNCSSIYTITDLLKDKYRATVHSYDLYEIEFERQDAYKLVPNKFDITTLVPFESRVLVRRADEDLWKPAIYGFSHSKGCYVVGGVYWSQCIPYEANKELLGTTNNPEEYGSR